MPIARSPLPPAQRLAAESLSATQPARPRLLVARTCLAWTILLGSLLAGAFGEARADEVQLRNGDRLTGKVVVLEEGVLTFKTTYAGEVKLRVEEIQAIRSEEPMKVIIAGPSEGRLIEFFSGARQIIMATVVGEGGIPFSEVQAVNLEMIRYRANIRVGGNRTSGNTETQAFNGAARLEFWAHRQRLFVEGKYNYGEAFGTVTARNSLGNFKYDYFLTERLFLNALELIEQDTFQRLEIRTTSGAALGYQLLNTARTTLHGELGFAYVYEHFRAQEVTQTPTTRWALRLNHELLPGRLSLFHKHDAFYDLAAGNAFRVLADQGIRILIYEGLYVSLEYDLRLNTQPAPGRQQLDESFIFGVGLQWQ